MDTKFKKQKMMPKFVFTVLITLITAPHGTAQSGSGEAVKNSLIDLRTAIANDYSDASIGIGWDLPWKFDKDFADIFTPTRVPGSTYWDLTIDAEARTQGVLLLDSSLNRDPINAKFRVTGFAKRKTVPQNEWNDWGAGVESATEAPEYGNRVRIEDATVQQSVLPMGFGLEGGWETDQRIDNSAFVLSAFALLQNELHVFPGPKGPSDALLFLVPTLEVSFDALQATSRETTSIGAKSNENFTRFRTVASYAYPLGNQLDLPGFLNSTALYGAVQFTKEFGQNAAWQREGLDEALGWFVEATFDLEFSSEKHTELFIRHSGGRIAPILKDEQALSIGVRHRF